MKKSIILILVILLLGLTGCGEQETEVTSDNYMYFVNTSETQVVKEPYIVESVAKDDLINEYMQALSMVPQNPAYKKAKPDDVVITDYKIGEDGQLVIYFDDSYNSMSQITEVLCRAVIVKTFCQIDDIDYVEFYVNGQSLMLSGDTPVGLMQESDFIDNTGGVANYRQTTYINVYFANETGDALIETNLKVQFLGSRTKEQLIMERLIEGPGVIDDGLEGMIDTLPEGTVINKISTKDGVCYVDFNDKFLTRRPEVTEEATIYAVVNSLVELSNVNKVQITINGETKKVYTSIDISGMLERNLEIIDSDN